jgi:hypothetical protein
MRLLGPLVFATSLAYASPAIPDTSKPYDYRLILRVAPHRLLTVAFCNQLRADLQDGLQSAFGQLAKVVVVSAGGDSSDRWLDLKSLETHGETGGVKRHFVEVSYADGCYIVRARQLDGMTGLASPQVRTAKTPDRSYVSRLIIGFVDEDFGPVGTVVGFGKADDRVELAMHGGTRAPAALAPLVPTGSVFALSRIDGSPPHGRPVEAAYLVAMSPPKDGRCECRFVYRFGDQLGDWAGGAYKALKLGTGRGPVRLRIEDANRLPVTGLQVQVMPDGFRSERVVDQGAVRDGGFESAHAFDGIAYVRITSGSRGVAQIPVPILGDRALTCRVNAAPGGEALQRLELDVSILTDRLVDIHKRLVGQHTRLGRLVDAKSHSEGLAEVERGLDRLDGELAALSSELFRLKREVSTIDPVLGPSLEQCDIFVREIRRQRERLLQNRDDFQNAIENEAKQEPQRNDFLALLQRAKIQRDDADFDGALKTYEGILNRFGDREEVRKKKDDLEREWRVKSEPHRQARAYVYETWPNVRTIEDVEQKLPKARQALAVCKQVGDRLTPLKLLLIASTPVGIVARAVSEIEKSESDTDRLNLPRLQKLSGELQEFIKEVDAYICSDDVKSH